MSVSAAFVIWAIVLAAAVVEGVRHGMNGWAFVIALAVAAGLFGFELFLAAPRVLAGVRASFGGRGGILAPIVPLFAALIYGSAVTGDWKLMLAGAAYAVIPALLLASSAGKSPGTWEDYVAVVALWLPVQFRWMYRMFSYPASLTHTLAILMALSTGVAAFVLVRRLDGVGYAVEWRRGFGANFALHFAIYAAVAIPLGIKIGFIAYDPSLSRMRVSFPLEALGILLFTAWPEEFLFRGLLQNLLSRTFKNEWAGLIAASAIFGLSHILHAPYPNWKYVLLATIAGLFYGHVWMKTRSLVPGTLVHALVDVSWHLLFR